MNRLHVFVPFWLRRFGAFSTDSPSLYVERNRWIAVVREICMEQTCQHVVREMGRQFGVHGMVIGKGGTAFVQS